MSDRLIQRRTINLEPLSENEVLIRGELIHRGASERQSGIRPSFASVTLSGEAIRPRILIVAQPAAIDF